MLELTVSEIEEKTRGVERIPLEYFRYIPQEVADTAQRLLDSNNLEKSLRYIENAFYIYRESVCCSFFAPHYLINGAHEWPPPAKFQWSNFEAVILGGEYIHGPIPETNSKVRITSESDKKIEETIIEKGEVSKIVREAIPGKDNFKEIFKYRIEDLTKIGFLWSMDWQNDALKAYANPIYWILNDFLSGALGENDAKKHFQFNLDNLKKIYHPGD